tara:strand:- start:589 stop:1026 length:438 start_codon:yes stop_codon:yes gene_type:complete
MPYSFANVQKLIRDKGDRYLLEQEGYWGSARVLWLTTPDGERWSYSILAQVVGHVTTNQPQADSPDDAYRDYLKHLVEQHRLNMVRAKRALAEEGICPDRAQELGEALYRVANTLPARQGELQEFVTEVGTYLCRLSVVFKQYDI